jgi:hypothetical protein
MIVEDMDQKAALSVSESSMVQVQAHNNSPPLSKLEYRQQVQATERISNISSSVVSPKNFNRISVPINAEELLQANTSKTTTRRIDSQQFVQDSSQTGSAAMKPGKPDRESSSRNQRLYKY